MPVFWNETKWTKWNETSSPVPTSFSSPTPDESDPPLSSFPLYRAFLAKEQNLMHLNILLYWGQLPFATTYTFVRFEIWRVYTVDPLQLWWHAGNQDKMARAWLWGKKDDRSRSKYNNNSVIYPGLSSVALCNKIVALCNNTCRTLK